MSSPTARGTRYSGALPISLLSSRHALVVGVGAIGHQVSLLLAAMGVPLTLIDPDTVSEVNLGPQLYRPDWIDWPKVDACKSDCLNLNPGLPIATICDRFDPEMDVSALDVFCCVDQMDARKSVHYASMQHNRFFCEARMGAESMEVRTCVPDAHVQWLRSWFPQSEARTLPCTFRSTPYCAYVCAGLMVAQYSRFLRNIPVDPTVSLDLFTSSFSTFEVPA